MRIQSSAKGVSMIELIIILGVLGGMIAATTGIVLKVVRNQNRNNFLNQVVFTRDAFSAALVDNRIWQTTVNEPSNNDLSCLKDRQACNPGRFPARFTLYETDGTPVLGYNPANPAEGFDRFGNVCRAFNPTTPDPECIYRMDFTVTPVTPGANPEVEIRILITFAIPEDSPLLPVPNPQNYEPPPLRRAGTPGLIVPGQCRSGEVLVGFKDDGTVECRTVVSFDPSGPSAGPGSINPRPQCVCPKGGCRCSKAGVCSCPGQCPGKNGCP